MRREPATGRKVRTDRHGKGLRWQAIVVGADGRERSKGFAREEDAKLWVIKAQTVPELVAPAVAFDTAARSWLAGHVGLRASSRTSTQRRLDTMILPAIGHLDLQAVTRAALQQMVAGWVEAGYSPSTMRTAWSHVVSVLTEAKLDKLIAEMPTEGVRLPSRPPKRVVPLTDDQVLTLMRVMPRSLRAMVLLGATSGLRPAELAGLTWDRVRGTVITVDRQLVTTRSADGLELGPLKTGSSYRDVSMGRGVIAELEEHRRIFGEGDEGLIFRAPMGGLMTRHQRSETWTRYRAHIGGVAGDGWHQLRHHHASKLLSAGVSVVAVAHRLGHKDATETLQTYAHLMPGDDERMVAVAESSAVSLLDRSGTVAGPLENAGPPLDGAGTV